MAGAVEILVTKAASGFTSIRVRLLVVTLRGSPALYYSTVSVLRRLLAGEEVKFPTSACTKTYANSFQTVLLYTHLQALAVPYIILSVRIGQP